MKKISLAIALSFLTLAGCNTEKFLDLKPESSLVEENYFRTTGEVETGVINLYDALQKTVMPEIQLSELRSDNISPNLLEGEWAAIDNFNETSSNDFVNTFWVTSYAAVARANIVLKYLNNVTDPAKKDRFEGEAKFVRALMLFNLVRLYGDVPLPLAPVGPDETNAFKRVPMADVYKQIITDLKTAEAMLPAVWEAANLGRATKGAAQALLGKVYLTQKDYASAKTALESVINGKAYQLLAKYSDVFGPGTEMNKEIIFAIRFRSASNGEGQSFSHNFSKDGATRGLKPLADMLALYSAEDAQRLAASVSGTGTNAFVGKFPDAANTGSRLDAGNDWIVLRYADVLLMYAEVLNQLTGPEAALPHLNAIRTRAGVPALTATAVATKAAMQQAIERERRVELAFENHRWYDLLRWGKAIEAMNTHFKAIGRSITVEPFRVLFPIPQRDIDLSKGVTTQNPGHS
jgi:starch-binding outer membrane protein, SusD/RagB family